MKELTVLERAKQALSIQYTEQELEALADKFSDIAEIKDNDDYSLVKGACREFQKVRVSIEKTGKAARDDANKFAKAVIGEEKRLLKIIVPEEDRLKALRKEVDDRAVREAEEKLAKETARKEAIEEKILYIRSFASALFGQDVVSLEGALDIVENIHISEEEYQEYEDNAIVAKNAVIHKLSSAIATQKEVEELRAQQKETARIQAEAQAKIDAENAKIRAQQEAIDKEKAQIAEAKLAEERKEAEKVRLEKERLEREKKDREAAERIEADRKAEAERQESLKPEKEKLIDWLKKLRFIDGVELHNKKLSNIQKSTLSGLAELSVEGIQLVNDA